MWNPSFYSLLILVLINQIYSLTFTDQLGKKSINKLNNNNIVLERTDLKAKINEVNSSDIIVLEKKLINYNNNYISFSRLHSNQLNDTFLQKMFLIQNKTNVLAVKSQLNRSLLDKTNPFNFKVYNISNNYKNMKDYISMKSSRSN